MCSSSSERIFMLATPAKWKVLSVICVPGSPMLWAPTAPTAVPGSILARINLSTQVVINCCSCVFVIRSTWYNTTDTISTHRTEAVKGAPSALPLGFVPSTGLCSSSNKEACSSPLWNQRHVTHASEILQHGLRFVRISKMKFLPTRA